MLSLLASVVAVVVGVVAAVAVVMVAGSVVVVVVKWPVFVASFCWLFCSCELFPLFPFFFLILRLLLWVTVAQITKAQAGRHHIKWL